MLERMKSRLPLIRPLLLPLILYIGALVLSSTWLSANPVSAWRPVVALLPILPGLFIALGVVRAILRLDEMEQRIILEAAAISLAGSWVLVLSLGFLESAGYPGLNGVYVALVMAVLLFFGKLWAGRRYE